MRRGSEGALWSGDGVSAPEPQEVDRRMSGSTQGCEEAFALSTDPDEIAMDPQSLRRWIPGRSSKPVSKDITSAMSKRLMIATWRASRAEILDVP